MTPAPGCVLLRGSPVESPPAWCENPPVSNLSSCVSLPQRSQLRFWIQPPATGSGLQNFSSEFSPEARVYVSNRLSSPKSQRSDNSVCPSSSRLALTLLLLQRLPGHRRNRGALFSLLPPHPQAGPPKSPLCCLFAAWGAVSSFPLPPALLQATCDNFCCHCEKGTVRALRQPQQSSWACITALAALYSLRGA